MLPFGKTLRALFALTCLALAAPLLADSPVEKKAAPAKFIRLQRNADKEPTALETAIVRYVPASGEGQLTVDLVAAVHIGDRAYYQKLNKQFEQYDVLLYELVAPQGTRIPKGGKREVDNPLALLQQLMKLGLALDSQTEQIDYTKKNFVHADMSPEQMADAMKKRGDDPLTLILSLTADVLRQQNRQALEKDKNPHQDQPEIDPIKLLTDPEGPAKLKRMMAQQMEDVDGASAGLGQTLNTILITDRNQAALKVFQTELTKGKKKIAIFYGAAHMPDFDKRLREDFGLKRSSEQWLTAWDLQQKPRNGIEDLLKLLK
jgi:hypothetical protein